MKERERKVCEEICAVGWTLDPPGHFWTGVETIFVGAMGRRMRMAWEIRMRRSFERYVRECRNLTTVLARCADPSYDPALDPDSGESWRIVNPARILSPLSPSERRRLINLLGHLVHCVVDRFDGTWDDEARFKAAVGDALEIGHRIRGLDFYRSAVGS